MDFKQIEAFVNVVRYESFSRAADATFFTQPTISAHISTLENELGMKLLNRKGRTVEMTIQGKEFYRYAVEMLNMRASALQALSKKTDNADGILEVETSSIPAITLIPEMMNGFHEKHEKTQFYVNVSDSQTVIDNISERRGEIGFVGENIKTPGIEYTKLFSDRVVLILPKDMKTDEKEITFKEMTSLPFIWRENGSATRKYFEKIAEKRGYDRTAFKVVALLNDPDVIIRSVEQGLGVSILSEKTFEKMKRPGVKAVRIEGFNKKRDFYMAVLKDVTLSSAALAFKKYVIENVAEVMC